MLQKLSFGQKVFGGAGIVFLISTFLAWFTISLKGGLSTFRVSGSASGWDIGFLWVRLPFFLVLAGLVVIGLQASGSANLAPKLTRGINFLAVAALTTLLVVLKFLIGEDFGLGSGGIDVSRGLGLYLGLLAAIALVGGGALLFMEGGGDLNDLKTMDGIRKSVD